MKTMQKLLRILLLPLLLISARAAFAQATLRVGDSIEVRLSGVPVEDMSQFSALYTVDDSGGLNLPYIGQVKVAGLPINQAQVLIETKLKTEKIFTHPTVAINQPSGTRFVNISGQVRSPGRIPYTADLKLTTAINAAGGPTDFADMKHIKLTRDNKATIYNAKELRKNPEKDPQVLPGDQIDIPQGFF